MDKESREQTNSLKKMKEKVNLEQLIHKNLEEILTSKLASKMVKACEDILSQKD